MRSSMRSWGMRHVAGSVIFRNAIAKIATHWCTALKNLRKPPMPKDTRAAKARKVRLNDIT